MSEKIRDIMVYLLKHHSGKLSNTAMNDLVYLADLHHVQKHHQPITNIKWRCGKRDGGPFEFDIQNIAEEHEEIFKTNKKTVSNERYKGTERIFFLKAQNFQPQLSVEEKEFLDHAIKESKKHGLDFHTHVQKTPPLQNAKPWSRVNIVKE